MRARPQYRECILRFLGSKGLLRRSHIRPIAIAVGEPPLPAITSETLLAVGRSGAPIAVSARRWALSSEFVPMRTAMFAAIFRQKCSGHRGGCASLSSELPLPAPPPPPPPTPRRVSKERGHFLKLKLYFPPILNC
ncbi:uncharacterized protein LOC143922357 [Arctopsyche grandis]|uniref:uncharacterized protein LOC143922109 n=1 Tax=Arctopsyche grandis TaxID=121162 RepID=UPI00406D69BF